ncbi:sensor histidine kinase [Anianabacter salinae]|uniref:sensor histidine kinase n=1 Tax=Anianabacter salinae TaxID=2851023 RepID=UPI00225E5227|nr:HAMP domain-containing sensor histidine kinase [Anianabacter salinae]MBV0912763.1 HAMP domain-containing histidine kinase [Anianabacter salinae]
MFVKATSIPKLQLATQLTIFVVFAVLVSVIAAYLVTLQAERSFEFRKAEARANTLAPALTSGGIDTILGVAWVLPRRDPLAEVPPPDIAALPVGHHLLQRPEGTIHAVVRPMTEGRRSIVLYASAPHLEQRATLLRLLGGTALVLVAATVALAPWWAGFLLRYDPMVRRRIGRQMSHAAREAFQSQGASTSTLALTYTEYVRLLYDPDERSREFIANVAHELRTPITVVRSGCEVIVGNPNLEVRNERRLIRMIAALDHMSETIESFVLLARDGDYGIRSRVEIAKLFAEVISLHAAEAEAREVFIVLGHCDPTPVEVPREALATVVSNLLRNAIRHGARGGQIDLTFRQGELRVGNNGAGISQEEKEKIFRPFYRARNAAEEGSFGLGLGLAIVKRICEACNWNIDVQSPEANRTVFSIRIL